MHYFIYPSKDATIYSGSTSLGSSDKMSMNAGLDEILEIDKRTQPDYLEDNWSRILIQFDLSNWVTHSNEVYYLNMYDAGTEEIPISNTLYCHPLSSSWEMGIGKKSNNPITEDGCTWTWRDVSGSNNWTNPGGDFVTEKNISGIVNFTATQSFEYEKTDASFDVTTIVKHWISGSIDNYGFIIKSKTMVS